MPLLKKKMTRKSYFKVNHILSISNQMSSGLLSTVHLLLYMACTSYAINLLK